MATRLGPVALAAAASVVLVLGMFGVDSARAQTPSPVTLSAGVYHTCAVTPSGGVKCWGDNGDGALGDGTNISRNLPTDVTDLASGVMSIFAGWYHTCALTTTGGVKCWGANADGQLGDGTTSSSTVPVDVIGLSSGVVAISGGGFHTCALISTGGVKCWGDNTYGQIGEGTNVDRSAPEDVTALPSSGVATIAAGFYHTCAATKTADVICWGWNAFGQLGDGTTIDRNAPVYGTGHATGAVAITAGEGHTCALTAGGGVKCWGANGYGQLGEGTFGDSTVAVGVTGLSGGVAAASSHGIHTCAVTMAGSVTCWGDNFRGQLGDGTTASDGTPVAVAGLSSGITAVAGGYYHACALSTNGGVKCWGWNRFGQLGDGTNTNTTVPVDVPGTFAQPAVAAPANDNFANAEVLPSATTPLSGTVDGATRESGEPAICPSFPGTVWYRWTADRNGFASIQSVPMGFCVEVWQGNSLSSLTAVSLGTALGANTFRALAGTTYNFAVAGNLAPPASFSILRDFIAADLVDATPGPGGAVSTDADGGGASPADPIETTVTTPNAGSVSITEFQQNPLGGPFTVLDFVVQITAPHATAAHPLTIRFVIDGSALPPGVNAATLQVFRNGVVLPPCTGAPAAVPDPCVSARATIGDDAVVTVLTSQASSWTFGAASAPALSLPPNITVDATSPTGATVTYSVTATGAGSIAVSCAPASGSMFSINPIGASTTVTCSATDADGNTALGTFTVHVRSAGEQIALLMEDVAAATTSIGHKLADDLQAKLADVLSKLSAGKIADACGKMNDFSGKVTAKAPQEIAASLASEWLARAVRIRAVLGC